VSGARSRRRISIEVPGHIEALERNDPLLARQWRLAARRAFLESLRAGFVVKEFCRSIRGQQGQARIYWKKEIESITRLVLHAGDSAFG